MNEINIETLSNKQKAKELAGYKHYKEAKTLWTKSGKEAIKRQIFILSLISDYIDWYNLFIPVGTRVKLSNMPDKFVESSPVYLNDPTPHLENGKIYTIGESVVGDSYSWVEFAELPEFRIPHSWYEIIDAEQTAFKKEAEFYETKYLEEDYARYLDHMEYNREQNGLPLPKEKEVEIFEFQGYRFDWITVIDDFYDEDGGEEVVLIDLCPECAEKFNLPDEYKNGEALETVCGNYKCTSYDTSVNYAIPVKAGRLTTEIRKTYY